MNNKKLLIGIIGGVLLTIIAILTVIIVNNIKNKEFEKKDETKYEDEVDSVKEAKVDWSNLEITMNGVEYKYPFKVSDFINNGWVARSSEDDVVVNKTIDSDFLSDSNADFYVGYNYIGLKQNDLILSLYFDTNTTNTRVIDANVIGFEVEKYGSSNINEFDFYGIKFGSTKETVEDLLGTLNYSILEDKENYTYTYSKKLNDNSTAVLQLVLSNENNKLYKINISIY